jgi:hypothetical protein
MGLSNGFLQEICSLKRRGALDGFSSVIEVGAQQLSNAFLRSDQLIKDAYDLFGMSPTSLGAPISAGFNEGLEHQSEQNPSSRQFWQSIGFRYGSIEFDGHRDSIALDLNRDGVPGRLRGGFDLVVNTGTTEHVANQDNAFRVMHDLCRHGGIMFHELPAGGMMTHGLITYTPKFFWHLCRENDYEAVVLKTIACGSNPVPQNIRDSNLTWGEGTPIPTDLVPDFMIVAALRKRHDREFITPLDVPPEIMPSQPLSPKGLPHS